MNRLVTVWILVAATMTVGVAAASPSAASRPAAQIPLLRVGMLRVVSNLDWARDGNAPALTSLSLESLVQFAPSGKIVPRLAASWSQPGPAVYVYHLRHGVHFWDGNELTATDVANALNSD
jgi:peptide/nickel transport system substrate-binding protein